MPYEGLGARHTVAATKDCVHGQIVTEEGFVGTAFKVDQIDRFVRPADAQDILEDEEFELQVGGVHEAAADDGLATADVGDLVWITPATNALAVFANAAAAAAGDLPVGVVTELDTTRDIVRINSNAWQAFLPGT